MKQVWLGLTDYREALEIQQNAVSQVRAGHNSFLFGVEHPSVVTLGKRAVRELDVQASCPLPVVEIDRGGQATLHQPGQLVIYPILDLALHKLDVRQYVEVLEKATIQSLQDLGIPAGQGHQPGIFTEQGKIGFIGVRVERGVTRHGVSMNVSNDLSEFQYIRSCGATCAQLTRVHDFQPEMSTEALFYIWCDHFLTLTNDLVHSTTNSESSLGHLEPIKSSQSSLGVVGSAFP